MRAVAIHTRHHSSRHEALIRRTMLRATHKGLRKGFRSLQVAAVEGREGEKTAAQQRSRRMGAARELMKVAERHFLRRVALGEVVAEYEGWWGLPERWWRIAEHAVPALSSLHFLPRYSLVSPLLLVAALLVLRLLLWMPEAPHEKEQ